MKSSTPEAPPIPTVERRGRAPRTTTAVKLKPEQHARVSELAATAGISIANLLRKALSFALEHPEQLGLEQPRAPRR